MMDMTEPPLKWWKRPAYIGSLAALLIGGALCTLGINAVITNDAVDRIDRLAVDNRTTLEAIERNQAGVDELVAFVREIQAEQGGGDGTDEAVRVVVDLLCASSDPVRVDACAELEGGAQP